MRNEAAVLRRVGEVGLEERPTPEPAGDQVLVEVRSVGVCGSDVHYYEHGRIGEHVVRAPLVLGHEASGVVVAAGPDADPGLVGTRVAMEPGVPCGRCRQCRSGAYNLCPKVAFFATPPVDGAFARYVCLPQDFVFPLPATLSDDAGALIEPLAVAVAAGRKAGIEPGDRVLVTGAGPIGILCAQVGLARGAAEVVVADINRVRLDRALELGASRVVDSGAERLEDAAAGVDVLLECTGVEPVVAAGIRAVGPGGRVVLVGMGAAEDAALPVSRIQSRELTVTGLFRYANCYPAAIALAESGRVDLEALIGARFPLEQAEQALTLGRTDPGVLKAVVRVGQPGPPAPAG